MLILTKEQTQWLEKAIPVILRTEIGLEEWKQEKGMTISDQSLFNLESEGIDPDHHLVSLVEKVLGASILQAMKTCLWPFVPLETKYAPHYAVYDCGELAWHGNAISQFVERENEQDYEILMLEDQKEVEAFIDAEYKDLRVEEI